MSKTQKSNYKRRNEKVQDRKAYKDKIDKGPKDNVAPRGAANHIEWYCKDDRILSDVASLSFASSVGTIEDFGVQRYGGYSSLVHGIDSVPGVMELDVVLTPGIANSIVSPINVSGKMVYSFTRHHNSGSWNYDPANLMMYLLAMDSVYAMFNDLKRLYGVMNTWSPYNKYLPTSIVCAMGYDYDDMKEHIVDLRGYINLMANTINTRFVPNDISYILRHSWMFSNVYRDSEDPKSQIYVYRMKNHYLYDEYAEPMTLKYVNRETNMTFAQAKAHLDTAMNALLASQSVSLMSGDLEKAYGNGQFLVDGVSPEYGVIPVFNVDVLNQMHNATILPMTIQNADIVEDVDTLSVKWDPTFVSSKIGYRLDRFIDIIGGDTTPGNIMRATRLTVPVLSESKQDNGTYHIKLQSCGSEIIIGLNIHTFTQIGNTTPYCSYVNIDPMYNVKDDITNFTVLSELSIMSKFRGHPCAHIFTAGDSPSYLGNFFDTDRYTTVDNEVLDRIHEVALMGEFGVIR